MTHHPRSIIPTHTLGSTCSNSMTPRLEIQWCEWLDKYTLMVWFVLFMLQCTATRSEVWASSRELQLLFSCVTMIPLPSTQQSPYHSGALINQFTQFMKWKCLSWYQLHANCIQEFLTMMAVSMATTKVSVWCSWQTFKRMSQAEAAHCLLCASL